jgi:N-acyl-D-aspartate/D-glutamate deacylase
MTLAEPLAERSRGTFAITHGPDFGPVELAELSARTGRPVTWTALNATPSAFRLLDKAAARDGEVWPQVACRPIVFQVTLAEPAPFARADAFAEVLSVPAAERARFYRDPDWRARARSDAARQWHYTWDKVFVQETVKHPELADGPSLAELGAQRGVDPLDVLCDVALDDGLQTRFRVVVANDDAESLARLLPTPGRTPVSCATRCSPRICWSTGSGRPARSRWRKPSGGSPGTRPRCSASRAGAGSRRVTSPTWSRSTRPRWASSGWSGSMTCPPAPTG